MQLRNKRVINPQMRFLEKIPTYVEVILSKEGIEKPDEILCTSITKFRKLGIKLEDIKLLRKEAANILKTPFTTAKALNETPNSWKLLSFGCRSLNTCMNGGIPTRGITDLCGESGAGKTQILLQLSLMVQLPEEHGGLGKGAIIICTEEKFQPTRLMQFVDVFKQNYSNCKIDYTENIYIKHVLETKDLLDCVTSHVPKLMENKKIGLIAIDSVAAVFRSESDYLGRANDMRKLGTALLRLVNQHQCAAVCVNQVASSSDDDGKEVLVPCLGLAWANLIRTRIKISRINENSHGGAGSGRISLRRKFEILFSPDCARNSREFLLTSKGIQDAPKRSDIKMNLTLNRSIKYQSEIRKRHRQ